MPPFENTKGTNATGSPRKDGSSAPRPATGSINNADRPVSHPTLKAHHPSSSPKSGATPVVTTSKQFTQATGLHQHAGSHSRTSTPPPLARDAPTLASSTRSTDIGDANRRSVGYPQVISGGPTPLHDRASGILPIARPGDPPTHAVEVAERGRLTQISKAATTASSRESSSEGSSATDTSDDEDPSQSPHDHDQPDDFPNLIGHGSGDTTATGGNVPLTPSVRRDQYTEAINPVISPPSRESSPPLSVDISTSDSLNSTNSSRDSPSNAPSKGPRILASFGRDGPADTVATQQLTETQKYDQSIDVSGKPDAYSSTVTPHAPLANLPTSEIMNSEDTGGSSASHVQPTELLSLTNLGIGGPGATESVKYLVQAVGRDVVSFRRNTHVSYMAVERARDMIKSINEYIAKVEDSETGDWDSFEKFTMAIEPLEEILFTLLAFTEDEKARYLANTSSIDDCISSAETWAYNRAGLSSALDGFDTRRELVGLFDEPDTNSRKSEHREAQIYDDRTLLEEMRNTIHTSIVEDSARFPSYVKDVETSLNRLQSKVIDDDPADWLTVITIKTSMLIEGVVEIVKVAALSTEILDHLRSRPVWKAASALIEFLEEADEREPTMQQSAQTKYDDFVETLKKLSKLVLPRTYVDLMKQAGRIRRPYHAQALALIGLCRFLADKFNALGDSVITVENVNALEDVFNKALVALQAAARAVTVLRTFNLTNFDTDDTVIAFGEAEVLIRDIFRSVSLEDEWTKKQSDLTAAFLKDKERMEKLNNMLNSPQSPSSETEKVTVNVSIRDKSPEGKVLGDTSVEEETSTRLLALRWRVAGVLKQEEIKRARTAGTFYKRTDNGQSEILASHSTLEEIAGGKSAVTLKFVVP